MAFDGSNLISGGGGGLLGTILTYLGFKSRLDSQEKRIEQLEQDVVYKDVHTECSKAWHDALARIDSKLDILLAEQRNRK
jgi:hypothetical protein